MIVASLGRRSLAKLSELLNFGYTSAFPESLARLLSGYSECDLALGRQTWVLRFQDLRCQGVRPSVVEVIWIRLV